MSLSLDDVRKILAIVNETDCEEVRLEVGDFKLHLRRHANGSSVSTWPDATPAQPAAAASQAPAAAAPVVPDAPRELALPDGVIAVKAPMVGTFYRAPSPGEAPFVEEGATVSADDTVCLVEVMKLFNSVKAGIAGKVDRVLVENGALVEYGQPLILIRKAGA